MTKEHPFATGVAVGVVGLLAYWKRHAIASFFRSAATKISHPFAGFGDDRLLPGAASGAAGVAVRQLKRYTFASMQDKSPIVGLTHASYAMAFMDFLEEAVGREAIQKAGYDPVQVRALITKLQDKHAEALRQCDPYIAEVLALERAEGNQLPGFVMAGAGGAPMGA